MDEKISAPAWQIALNHFIRVLIAIPILASVLFSLILAQIIVSFSLVNTAETIQWITAPIFVLCTVWIGSIYSLKLSTLKRYVIDTEKKIEDILRWLLYFISVLLVFNILRFFFSLSNAEPLDATLFSLFMLIAQLGTVYFLTKKHLVINTKSTENSSPHSPGTTQVV